MMPSKNTDLEENGTMPAESHCQAADGDHNALLTIHQSFATRSPLCVKITILHWKCSP